MIIRFFSHRCFTTILCLTLLFGLQFAATSQDSESVDLESLPWSGERILTALDAHTIAPTIVADDYGLHVIYQELRTMGDSTVGYMFSPDLGKTWINRQRLSSTFSLGVGTSLMSDKGVLHAVWCPTERGLNGLNYRRSTNGGKNWERERVLTETSKAIYLPKIYSDNNRIYLVWVEKLIVGADLSSRSPSVRDLDIRSMTFREERRPGQPQESYDCTLNIMTSTDGGDSWTPKQVVDRIFEDIRVYNFRPDGGILTFNLRLPNDRYLRVESRDRGLIWQRRDISADDFGAFEPPSVVKYRDNYFHIGTKEIDNRAIIFLTRTDSIPPEAQILNTEKVVTRESHLIQWTGTDDWSDTARLRFRYRINDQEPSLWIDRTELSLSRLNDGKHAFTVEAMDEAGNISAPVDYVFDVQVPPETTILTELPPIISDRSPEIEWSGTDNTTPTDQLRYFVSLNEGPWRDMESQTALTLSSLTDGRHLFAVRAVDLAGNEDPSPATIEFFLDTIPPRTTAVEIGRWVPGVISLTCTITAQDNITPPEKLKFSLELDGHEPSPFVDVPSLPVKGLDDGEHLLLVRAMDEAGNVEQPPYEHRFSIEIPPEVRILSAPVFAVRKVDFEVLCEVRDNTTPPERILLSYRINEEPWSVPLPGALLRIRRDELGPGRYRFQVKAVDERGNESLISRENTFEFLVDPAQLLPPQNLKIASTDEGVYMEWQLPAGQPIENARFHVYRSSTGGFGLTTEERLQYRIAESLDSMRFHDVPPSATGGIPLRYLYAVSMTDGHGRESPLSRIIVVDFSPEGRVLVTAGVQRHSIGLMIPLLILLLLVLFVIAILGVVLLLRRRNA